MMYTLTSLDVFARSFVYRTVTGKIHLTARGHVQTKSPSTDRYTAPNESDDGTQSSLTYVKFLGSVGCSSKSTV